MVRRLLNENELIPYAPAFPPGRRWLVLAPHPDDELFGAGATIAEARAREVEVKLVVVTDGAAQCSGPAREQEARAAANALGIGEPEFWRLPDRGLAPWDPRLLAAIASELRRSDPECVLVPSPVDLHPDHRATALALQRVIRRHTWFGLRRANPTWVLAYEVGTPIAPNLLVASERGWETKLRAAHAYASQLDYRPYDRMMEALGMFRALTLDGATRAEAFHLVSGRELGRRSARWWALAVRPPTPVELGRTVPSG